MRKESLLFGKSPIGTWLRINMDDLKKESIKVNLSKRAIRELQETSKLLGMTSSAFVEVCIMAARPMSDRWVNSDNRRIRCREEMERICKVKATLKKKQRSPVKNTEGVLESLLIEALGEDDITVDHLKKLFTFADIDGLKDRIITSGSSKADKDLEAEMLEEMERELLEEMEMEKENDKNDKNIKKP